jgi:hypothetical protein
MNNTFIEEVINKSFLSRLTSARASNTKRRKIVHYAPITFGRIQTTLGKPITAGIKILFDPGPTKTHVKRDFVQKLQLQKETAATWTTTAGTVSMNEKCKVLFSLPEFSPSKVIELETHIRTLENITYDMIIGNDLLEHLKIDLKYSTSTIVWDSAEISMKS